MKVMAWNIEITWVVCKIIVEQVMKNKITNIFGLWFKTKHLKIFFLVIKPLCLIKKKREKEAIIQEENQQERLHVSPGMKGKEWRERATIPTLLHMSDGKCYCWFVLTDSVRKLKKIWNVTYDLQLAWNPYKFFFLSYPPSEESFCGMLSLVRREDAVTCWTLLQLHCSHLLLFHVFSGTLPTSNDCRSQL